MNTFEKILLFLVFFLTSINVLYPQKISQLITPNSELNRKFHNFNITGTKLIRFEEGKNGLTLDFRLPAEWTYTAGKNLQTKFGRIDFAFYNGMVYSNSTKLDFVSFRKRIYPELFTDKIKSNAFAIGFRKKDQAAIFVVSEEPKQVFVEVDKSVMGRRLYYEFYMNKNDSKLIRIINKFPPYLP